MSGLTELYTITATFIHFDVQLVILTIDDEELETTPEHPFFTEERGWVDAAELQEGEHVRRADGSSGTVQFVALTRQPQMMYNLTVAEAHTFFVGDQRWLVHNLGGNDCFPDIVQTPRGRKLTTHAKESLIRHGFKPPFADVDDIIDNYTRKTYQTRDNAAVYIKKMSRRGKVYAVAIVNEADAIITAIQNLSSHELRNLGRNHGFDPGY